MIKQTTLKTFSYLGLIQHCTNCTTPPAKPEQAINCKDIVLGAPTIKQLALPGSNWDINNGSAIENKQFPAASFLKPTDRVILENKSLLVVAEMPGAFNKEPIVRFFTAGDKGQHFLNLFLNNGLEVTGYNNNYEALIHEQNDKGSQSLFVKTPEPRPTPEELATNWAAHSLVGSLDNGFVSTVYSALGLPDAGLIREEKQGLDKILELGRKATSYIQAGKLNLGDIKPTN